MFKPGDKVMCVDWSQINSEWHGIPLRLGEVYTIRSVEPERLARGGAVCAVREIHNAVCPDDGLEYSYAIAHFRKLDDIHEQEGNTEEIVHESL